MNLSKEALKSGLVWVEHCDDCPYYYRVLPECELTGNDFHEDFDCEESPPPPDCPLREQSFTVRLEDRDICPTCKKGHMNLGTQGFGTLSDGKKYCRVTHECDECKHEEEDLEWS